MAARLDGVVINADSMQVYRELRVVTARPSKADEAQVPHRLYGVLRADDSFSTGDWVKLAEQEITAARQMGKFAVVVGGTGLYFRALTEGLTKMPTIPAEIRDACRTFAEEQGLDGVRQRLLPLDPDATERLQDLQRLTRALEVVEATGRTLASWQAEDAGTGFLNDGNPSRVVMAPPRPWLHERIALRSRMMLETGGLDEVEALLDLKLPSSLPAMRAIGVKEIGALLSGEADEEETLYRLIVATRQYAKRQETWFRNQMPDWPRVDPSEESAAQLADKVCANIQSEACKG